MRFLAPLLALALLACTPAQMQSDSPLRPHGLLAAPHRTPVNVARDPFRHPFGTLSFFGIREDSVVVEILPGSAGYYMEILAPFVRDQGLYIAASRDATAAPQYLADHQKLLARLEAEPELYGKVRVTQFNAGLHDIAPPGSADFVLTFRNLHNWVERDEVEGALRAFHKALKPGGVLGVVDHRGRPQPGSADEIGLPAPGLRHRADREGRLSPRRRLGGQRQPERHERPPRGRVDPAADLPPEGPGPREVPGDRRERPLYAAGSTD
jgi:predicted methyltransferase